MRTQHPVAELVGRHRDGAPVGIYSVCSAHPHVLQASFAQCKRDDSVLLIEATCNQVNQYGGYTGMKPRDFAIYCKDAARSAGLPVERLILGGDHLGPAVWTSEPAESAMEKACELVQRYVEAGFTKIHLDASMSCKGDPEPLPDALVAERAAQLCAAAESAEQPERSPVYVIGTEVPFPGGAQEQLGELD